LNSLITFSNHCTAHLFNRFFYLFETSVMILQQQLNKYHSLQYSYGTSLTRH
jgi:hypothetical protein